MSPSKHGHLGIYLTGDSDNTVGIMHDFDANNPKTRFLTSSKGTCSFFVILEDADLLHLEFSHCMVFYYNGQVTYIESTQLCDFPQQFNGNIVAFNGSCSTASLLGIIQNLSVMQPKTLALYELNGGITNVGILDFIKMLLYVMSVHDPFHITCVFFHLSLVHVASSSCHLRSSLLFHFFSVCLFQHHDLNSFNINSCFCIPS